MIKVSVGGEEQVFGSGSVSWIREKIMSRRETGQNVCVRVSISTPSVNLIFATPACGGGSGIQRELSNDEETVAELWKKRGLNSDRFDVGQLVAFLNQIKS
jgi:hypothetical protein